MARSLARARQNPKRTQIVESSNDQSSGYRRPRWNWKWKLEAWNCDTERVTVLSTVLDEYARLD